jgi:putative DNA primase/helicase
VQDDSGYRAGGDFVNIRAAQRALGGDVVGRDTVLCPGPGHGARDRSLTVRLSPRAPDGFVVFSFSGDDWRECRDYVRGRLGLPQWQPGDGQPRHVSFARLAAFDRAAVAAEAASRIPSENDAARTAYAKAIWERAIDPRGTLAEVYLRSRALELPDALAGNVLRFHPHVPWRDENTGAGITVPALVAAFTSIDDDMLTAIQRVALTSEGAKINRRMLGIVKHAAIKLAPASTTLVIGEGVETAMAARQLGLAPVWALGSVGAIAGFPIIDGVECLRILGETGEASERAVKLCGQRWHAAGRKVQIITPDAGSDLNDEIMMARASA